MIKRHSTLPQMIIFVLLVATMIFSLYYYETYLSAEHRIIIGWALLVLLGLLFKAEATQKGPLRLFFLFLGALVALRYILWRSFETIMYTGPLDYAGMILLYFAEVYAVMIHMMGLFINAFPLEHKPVPLTGDPESWPTVDVLIPCYTEPLDIIKVTAIAATQMDYPKDKLRVYIIDDGSTIARRNNPAVSGEAWQRFYQIRRMAKRLGVDYLTREQNNHAKAGNINAALRKTDGDLVVVLDCDHVPTRDFLQQTVGRFLADPKLYLVQTPHFFINPTPVEKNLQTVSNVSVENDMFFRIIHLGFNSWNSSYFCGSAAVLRRSMLMEAGGLCGETITEDAETSIVLHSKGYNSVYINRPMVCGLSPETFSDYIIQRTRWAQGMIQLFLLHNPIYIKGLSIPQRICYFNSCVFWFFGFPRIIYFVSPALFLIMGLKVYHASLYQIIAYALPHLLATFFVMDFLYGKTRKPLFSEIYETVQSLFLLPAVISVILHPRKPTFKITPKGQSNVTESLNPMAFPFILVIAVNIVATILAVYKWINFPIYRDVIIVTGSWCIFNLFLVIVSLGAFWERKQVRYYHRINSTGKVEFTFPAREGVYKGDIVDISLSGIGFMADLPFIPKSGEPIVLRTADTQGKPYEFTMSIARAFNRGKRQLVGTNLDLTYENFNNAVAFAYGDSNRWVEFWDAKSAGGSSDALKLIGAFFFLGIKAVNEIIVTYLRLGYAALRDLVLKLAQPKPQPEEVPGA